MVVPAYLFAGDRFAVHGPPCVPDIGCDERDHQRDDAHHFEREFARRRVVNRQRRLHLRQRRVVGRVVPSGAQQQGQYRQHGARAAEPDGVALPAPARIDAPQHRYHADQQRCGHVGHFEHVVQVFIRFGRNAACGIDRQAVGKELPDEERQEEDEERGGERQHAPAGAGEERLVGDVVHEILAGQHPGEEHHGQPQRHVAHVSERFETVPRRGPLRDDRCAAAACAVGQVEAVHREVCTREECKIFDEVMGIAPDHVYVKYQTVKYWGWNSDNI